MNREVNHILDDTNNNYHDMHPHKKYNNNTIKTIQGVYIIASLLWVVLIYVLGLHNHDYIVKLLLLLPLVVFVINFISLGDFMCEYEDQMFRGNFLSFGFLVAIILINWNNPLEHNLSLIHI